MCDCRAFRLSIYSDCAWDAVARGDLANHWFALGGGPISIEGLPIALRPGEHVQTTSYASHALYRALVAKTVDLGREGHPGGIAVNSAPRDDEYPNGVPFCSFRYHGNVVTAPFDGPTLRMVRRYLGVTHVNRVDIAKVLQAARAWDTELTAASVRSIANQKFRSLWFQPRYTLWLLENRIVPSERVLIPIPEDDDVLRVSFIDGFDNVFFNLTSEELGLEAGDWVTIPRFNKDGRVIEQCQVKCYDDFSLLKIDEIGLLVGYGFPMLIQKCGSAEQFFGFRPGQEISLHTPSSLVAASLNASPRYM